MLRTACWQMKSCDWWNKCYELPVTWWNITSCRLTDETNVTICLRIMKKSYEPHGDRWNKCYELPVDWWNKCHKLHQALPLPDETYGFLCIANHKKVSFVLWISMKCLWCCEYQTSFLSPVAHNNMSFAWITMQLPLSFLCMVNHNKASFMLWITIAFPFGSLEYV